MTNNESEVDCYLSFFKRKNTENKHLLVIFYKRKSSDLTSRFYFQSEAKKIYSKMSAPVVIMGCRILFEAFSF